MKQANYNLDNSHRGFPQNLGARVIGCLLAFSMLTYGLAAIASERPAESPHSVIGRHSVHGGEQSQDNQNKAKDKQQESAPLIVNPFEAMTMALEVMRLSANPSKENATESLKKYKEAYAYFKSQNIKLGMAVALFACGGAYSLLGQPREAVNAFLEASEYSKESGFDFLRPLLEAGLSTAYVSLGETDKALEMINRSLPMVRSMNNPLLLAHTLRGLGEIYTHISQKRKALEYLKEARDLYHQTDTWQLEIQVLVLISALSSSLGQSTEAFEAARAALTRSKEKNDTAWETHGHLAFAAAYASVGNMATAIAEYTQAAKSFHAQNDKYGEATALNNLGLLYFRQGEFEVALGHFKESLKLQEGSDDPKITGYALNNIGTTHARRGEPLMALHHFEKALAIARQHDDRRLKATILTSMSEAYFLMNNREYALRLLKESAATFRELEEPTYEAEALTNLADAYGAMGRYREALDLLRPVLESRRLADDPGREGYVLREMGYMYTNMGDRNNALKNYAAALSKLEAAGDVSGQVDLYAAMGTASVVGGDYREAEELYRKGLAMARAGGLRQSEMLILAGLGFMHEKKGDPAQAESFYDQGIAVSESLRSSARIEELKTGVGSIATTLLVPALRHKFKLGKWAEAFEIAERARARTFLDQMNNARIDIGKGADPKLVEQEQSLRFDIRLLEEKLRKQQQDNPASEAARIMAASLKEKEEAYDALNLSLKVSHPAYAELQSYSPRPLNEIQRLLGPHTTLISYFVTADKTLAFVVGPDSFQAVEVDVKKSDLRAQIDWFRGFASLRDPKPQSLKRLHAWLIAPIRQHIKTANVVIVPHDVLHYVPFAALTDGRTWFGDEHAIYYLPSASILPSIRRRVDSDGKRVLSAAQSRAEGLPALRFADEEARSVARLYNTQPLPTGRATRAEFLKRAPAYDMLHIAAHAELNAHSPLFSRILLSPDKTDSGAIEVREVYGMDLARANLVVLSACQTQLGAQSKGDDIVGLNRAFIYAGASSVIASLWRVDDQATSFLMKAFYGNLKRGLSKAAALQVAQIATRKKYPHPYYWAAFVLTGDPGKTGR